MAYKRRPLNKGFTLDLYDDLTISTFRFQFPFPLFPIAPAEWLSEVPVFYDVAIEPPLQPLTRKVLSQGLLTDGIKLGLILIAGGFWG